MARALTLLSWRLSVWMGCIVSSDHTCTCHVERAPARRTMMVLSYDALHSRCRPPDASTSSAYTVPTWPARVSAGDRGCARALQRCDGLVRAGVPDLDHVLVCAGNQEAVRQAERVDGASGRGNDGQACRRAQQRLALAGPHLRR